MLVHIFYVGLFKVCTFNRLVQKYVPLLADPGFLDPVSGNTQWIQQGTVLADWWNTRADNAAAGSWPAVAGPNIPRIMYRTFLLCLVLLCLSFVLGGRVRQIR